MTRSDEETTASLETGERRQKPVVHLACDPPLCDSCQEQELCFFDLVCQGCRELLRNPGTTVAEVLAVMRQWTPQTQRNMREFVDELLTRGIHINDRDGLTDMTVLHYAVKSGAAGVGDSSAAAILVRKLLARGASVSAKCRWTGMIPLHYAASFDVPQVINILLKASKGRYLESRSGEYSNGTSLHLAARHLAYESARMLLQQGADPWAKDDLGQTPLDCVADPGQFGSGNRAVLEKVCAKLSRILRDAQHARGSPTLVVPSPRGGVPKPAPVTLEHPTAVELARLPKYDHVHGKTTLQAMGMKLGEKVLVGGVKVGILRFCGPTEFAGGVWAGLELEEPAGKNDGSVSGVTYFTCPPKHGIFAPITKLSAVTSGRRRSSSQSRSRSRSASVTRGRIDISHVTSRIDTGLHGRAGSESSTAEEVTVGDRVLVAGHRKGTIRFAGKTSFAPGVWFGIELDRPVGKNDGAVSGERYFTCKPRFGVFAPPSRVQRIHGSMESIDSDASGGGGAGINYHMKRTLSAEIHTRRGSSSDRSKRSRTPTGRSGKTKTSANRRDVGRGELRLQEGMSVFCNNELATIRYIGPTDFAEGVWLGVELRTPMGKNDGTVRGKRYFTCRPDHGLIVRPSKVSVRGINGAKLLSDHHRALEREPH